MEKKKVKIQAIKVPEGKTQHMIIGQVYEVSSEQKANALCKKKFAIILTESKSGKYEVGKVYDTPKSISENDK